MNRLVMFLRMMLLMKSSIAFSPLPQQQAKHLSTQLFSGDDADSEIVARRIVVNGDVQGGYYRACVKNEAGRFRKLVGTMTPPDDTDEAEIYVEGKEKMVDGFVRWVKRGKVGLSQVTTVTNVIEEEPTGLYDGFYVKLTEDEEPQGPTWN